MLYEPTNDALERHATAAYAKLVEWLTANNYMGGAGHHVEVALALDAVGSERARFTRGSDARHFYPELRPGEIAATADLIVVPADRARPILVHDHKTGTWGDFTRPEELAQLKVIGEAACEVFGRGAYLPTILHAPRGGIPVVYEGAVQLSGWGPFRAKLRRQLELIGTGNLRPGPQQCRYCPARPTCPAHQADVVRAAGKLVEKATLIGSELVLVGREGAGQLSREERIGRLHQLMQRFRELDKSATEQIRRELEENPELEPTRPDGKTLELVPKRYETLSKASILRALGAEEGGKMIERLRTLGCIDEVERLELRAK